MKVKQAIQAQHSFSGMIDEATRILKGEKELAGIENEEIRDVLLSQYKYIFVDEYQNIDREQYEFISAITGRL